MSGPLTPAEQDAFPSAWSALSHAEWIAYDCAIIDRCTHMLMMPRWETSAGALQELNYWTDSRSLKSVAYSVAELTELVRRDQPEPPCPACAAKGKP